jgi:hypothetical protein
MSYLSLFRIYSIIYTRGPPYNIILTTRQRNNNNFRPVKGGEVFFPAFVLEGQHYTMLNRRTRDLNLHLAGRG